MYHDRISRKVSLKRIAWFAVVSVILLSPDPAAAFNPDVVINAKVSLDTVNSVPLSGSASMSTTLELVSGSAITSSSWSAIPSPPAELTGSLTDSGDYVRGLFAINGSSDDESPGLFGDIFLDMTNNSITETYEVMLTVDFANHTDADGEDAYGASAFTLDDETSGMPFEIFFTDLTSDTLNGDDFGGSLTGTFGGPLNDAGSTFLNFSLSPGGMVNLHGVFSLEGGEFAGSGSYSASLDGRISVVSVVPEPLSSLLFVTGGAVFAFRRRFFGRRGGQVRT